MDQPVPQQFDNVSVVCKANVYFSGKVVSHTLLLAGGIKKTLGLIFPGSYTFNTEVAERMDIVAGACRVRVAGAEEWADYPAGTAFHVPANASFDIAVAEGVAEYLCSFE